MYGQIVLGVVLIGMSLLYFWLSPKMKGRSQSQRYDDLAGREKPFAPAPLPSFELVFLGIIGIGAWQIVSAIFL